jgi:uncharacterized damage-inducible protein DinB
MPFQSGRPGADEYMPYFAGYINRVPDGDLIAALESQHAAMVALLTPLSRERLLARPTPEDWNILEVLGHITDGEQVFAYRALRIARGDQTPLAGFEQDPYVQAGNFSARSLESMLEAYSAVRRVSITLFASLDAEALARRGVVSGHTASARAFAYIAAGHELHHLADFHARYGI